MYDNNRGIVEFNEKRNRGKFRKEKKTNMIFI